MAKNQQEQEAAKRRENAILLKKIFGTPDGQKGLKLLMSMAGFFENTTANTPHLSAFNDGKRSLVVSVIKALKIDPNALYDAYFDKDAMIREEDFGYDEYPEDEIY